jgi:hypothetical protein
MQERGLGFRPKKVMHTVDISRLHSTLLEYIIEQGYAPDTRELAVLLDVPEAHIDHAFLRGLISPWQK